jgi:hypothetical protein
MGTSPNIDKPDKIALWKMATDYNIYSAHAKIGDWAYLKSIFDEPHLKMFEGISRDPEAAKVMQTLYDQGQKFYDQPHLLPANPQSSPVPPWEHIGKGLENIESGILGALFQMIGAYLHPNDNAKAIALGAIGKTLGIIGEQSAKYKALKDAKSLKDENRDISKKFDKPDAVNKGPGDLAQKNLDDLMKYIHEQGLTGPVNKDKPDPGMKSVDQNKAPDPNIGDVGR